MPRAITLGIAAVCIFAVVAAIMLQWMPRPLKDSDYMVIGSVATLVALLGLFLAMIATSRPSNVFFKKRKKP
ncbi:MAG TPA: hypothetical protein VMB85_07030 [Bryobacteraceae bacterium]|jgi:hypothetical protein|nr:hypothetical protein [Bryobacteraceae bacterium]